MKKTVVILSFICLLLSQIRAQEQITVTMPRLRLGIEAGIDGLFGERDKPAMIRENQSSYYYYDYDYDYYCGFIPDEQDFFVVYIGVKPEYSVSKRFAVAAGVRFSFSQANLNSDKDYFLWRINETGTSTNYIKIKDISQKNYYIGIPLELKFFPREKDYPVRHYFAVGGALNFLAASDNDVSFQNATMKKYDSEVSKQIGKPNSFYGNLYGGFGLKIGNTSHPFGHIEFHLPVCMFAKDKLNSFIKGSGVFGFGVQMTLQIPMFSKHQLVYTVND